MRGKKVRATKRDTKIKGKVVEQIVAAMHHVRGVTVEPNKRLPSLRSPKRKREIDVLVSSQVLGYPVRFAFECKNYDRVVDVTKIGEFADKLNDVGLSTRSSFFVSVSGFTEGAVDRAKQLGMGTLLLRGLSEDRFGSMAVAALQSIVHLLPVVTQFSFVNDAPSLKPEEGWVWFDENGNPVAQLPDLIWHRWREGDPPSIIGLHDVQVDAPGWSHQIGGQQVVPTAMHFKVHVHGVVISFEGRGKDHSLIDAIDNQIKKRQVNVSFETQHPSHAVRVVETEEALAQFIDSRPESLKVITRVRLPRVKWGELFWPMSERVQQQIKRLAEAAGPGQTISEADFLALERDPRASVWEPPAFIPPKPRTA